MRKVMLFLEPTIVRLEDKINEFAEKNEIESCSIAERKPGVMAAVVYQEKTMYKRGLCDGDK